MRHIESMQEICSILNKIEDAGKEAAVFLHLYGYDERPDIIDPEESLVKVGIMLKFDATATRKALQKVCEEQKENGHPEIATAALKLALHLGDLEKETLDKNSQ